MISKRVIQANVFLTISNFTNCRRLFSWQQSLTKGCILSKINMPYSGNVFKLWLLDMDKIYFKYILNIYFHTNEV